MSGNLVLVGGSEGYGGVAHVFKNAIAASGTKQPDATLYPSVWRGNISSKLYNSFGFASVLAGDTALVGCADALEVADPVKGTLRDIGGVVYVYHNLNTASGTRTEHAQLVSVNGFATNSNFGCAVAASGSTAIVGASNAFDPKKVGAKGTGAAYVYRNVTSAAGLIPENATLVASDSASDAQFGTSVAVDGDIAVVGMKHLLVGSRGAAYVYRNLGTSSGTRTENAKLLASDTGGHLGYTVAIVGNTALVGSNLRRVYLYRSLNTVSGSAYENAKIEPSDKSTNSLTISFGNTIAMSGDTALVGPNSAYLYLGLNAATGTVTENVVIKSSPSRAIPAYFAHSIALEGDNFALGGYDPDHQTKGETFTGTVSSVTTLDVGSATRTIEGFGFASRQDWIVGRDTSNNKVVLGAGDTADVTSPRMAVFIGKNAGANNNTIELDGYLVATLVNVGTNSGAGNSGNMLVCKSYSTSSLTGYKNGVEEIRLAKNNSVKFAWSGASTTDVIANLKAISTIANYYTTKLYVYDNGMWQLVTQQNAANLLTIVASGGTMTITAKGGGTPPGPTPTPGPTPVPTPPPPPPSQPMPYDVYETKISVKTSTIKEMKVNLPSIGKLPFHYRAPVNKSYTLVMAYDGGGNGDYTKTGHGRMWSKDKNENAFTFGGHWHYTNHWNTSGTVSPIGNKSQNIPMNYIFYNAARPGDPWIYLDGLATIDKNGRYSPVSGVAYADYIYPVRCPNCSDAEQGLANIKAGTTYTTAQIRNQVENKNWLTDYPYFYECLMPAGSDTWVLCDAHFYGTFTMRHHAPMSKTVHATFESAKQAVNNRVPEKKP